jgi:uncharacterized lipoprotein YbaY/heat shock protein HslJ
MGAVVRGVVALGVLLAAALLVGCAQPGGAASSVIGSATYRERIALPPQAVFEATLEEVSRADAPALVVASTRVPSPKVPIVFSIGYDPARIEANRRYVVRGRITLDGQLMFTSDIAQPVLGPSGVRHVDLLLRRVADSVPLGEARRLLGLYRYMADAASLLDCTSGDQFPIAPGGEAAALQQAYLAVRALPGEARLAAVLARVVKRVPEPGVAARPALQIERLLGVSAQTQCEAPPPGSAALDNTYWKLVSLRGQAVSAVERQREPHLILQPAQRRVVGSGGCNRLSGSYTLDGERLTFGRAAGTMMACRDGMEQERAFLDALAQVVRWRIDGQRLAVFDERGAVVLQFEAVYLR